MATWGMQLVIRPNSVTDAADVLKELAAMVRRARPRNCFQINRSEIEALKVGNVPDALHVIIGSEPIKSGRNINDEVWTAFDQKIISSVRVAHTKCPFTKGIVASFSDYVSFGLSDHSLNDSEIDLNSAMSRHG